MRPEARPNGAATTKCKDPTCGCQDTDLPEPAPGAGEWRKAQPVTPEQQAWKEGRERKR